MGDYSPPPPDLSAYQALSGKGAVSGYAGLGTDARIEPAQSRVGDVLDIQVARKTADESVTSSTTLQNDDHLLIPLGANEVWAFDFVLQTYANTTTPDLKLAFTVPASGTVSWGAFGGSGAEFSSAYQSGSGSSKTFPVSSNGGCVMGGGVVTTGATSGNLQLQFAQDVSDANAVRLNAGCILIARRIA